MQLRSTMDPVADVLAVVTVVEVEVLVAVAVDEVDLLFAVTIAADVVDDLLFL